MFQKARQRLARWLDGSRELTPPPATMELNFVQALGSQQGLDLPCQGYEMFGTVEPCGNTAENLYVLVRDDAVKLGEGISIALCATCQQLVLGDANTFVMEAAIDDEPTQEAGDQSRQLLDRTGSREQFKR